MAIAQQNYTIEYVESLRNNGVAEGKTIEYKQEWYGDSDSQRKEFLKDVSAMANTDGGQIIIGVEEIEACISKIEGILIKDIDAFGLKIQQQLSSGLNPKLFTAVPDFIFLDNQKYLIVLDIPKSWTSPHMVTYKGGSSFYKRNSSGGVYQLDVNELKEAFLMAETIYEKIRRFRVNRYEKIQNNELHYSLTKTAYAVLHICSLSSFSETKNYLDEQKKYEATKAIPLYTHSSGSKHYNFDGIISICDSGNPSISEYTQFFRNGNLELTSCAFFMGEKPYSEDGYANTLSIRSLGFEQATINAVYESLAYLLLIGCQPPFFVFLGLFGVSNHALNYKHVGYQFFNTKEIKEENLILPEVLFETIPDNKYVTARLLKPNFDIVWNACGERRSPYYDNEGNFNENL